MVRQGEIQQKRETKGIPAETMIPVYQVAELIKTLNLNQLTPPSREHLNAGNHYQPIVGSVNYTQVPVPQVQPQVQNNQGSTQPPQPQLTSQPPTLSQSYAQQPVGNQYGMYLNQFRRPRNEFVCFTCGQHGHHAFECNSPNPLPREEQERLRSACTRMQEGSGTHHGGV